jgi:hypothetical protein
VHHGDFKSRRDGDTMWLWGQWRLLHIGKRNILLQNSPRAHPFSK